MVHANPHHRYLPFRYLRDGGAPARRPDRAQMRGPDAVQTANGCVTRTPHHHRPHLDPTAPLLCLTLAARDSAASSPSRRTVLPGAARRDRPHLRCSISLRPDAPLLKGHPPPATWRAIGSGSAEISPPGWPGRDDTDPPSSRHRRARSSRLRSTKPAGRSGGWPAFGQQPFPARMAVHRRLCQHCSIVAGRGDMRLPASVVRQCCSFRCRFPAKGESPAAPLGGTAGVERFSAGSTASTIPPGDPLCLRAGSISSGETDDASDLMAAPSPASRFVCPGAPAYDRGAVVAQYRGTLRWLPRAMGNISSRRPRLCRASGAPGT